MANNTFGTRLKSAWNAFNHKEDEFSNEIVGPSLVGGGSMRPQRIRASFINKDSVVVPIYNRISIDVSMVDIRHVRVDDADAYQENIQSYLGSCLYLDPNIDQSVTDFLRDVTMTLCEYGAVAIVPVESRGNPIDGEAYDPVSLRVGTIVEWFPKHVRVDLYNDQTGRYQEVLLPKKMVAIVENPLYAVMNDRNSTLQRLIEKLRLLDVLDDQNSSGKLDLIIQLPYVVKSQTQKEQAERRRKDIEDQMVNSKYGIAYTDGTERITQLNRPAENNLLAQVEYLTEMLYGQLGLTKEIIDGTAEEAAMINYFTRTIEPFLLAITQSMTKTFISKTALTQGQRIRYYRDPFKLAPISQIAEIADKFTRNEIASSNELRSAIGWRPSKDPKADELRNSNLSAPKNTGQESTKEDTEEGSEDEQLNTTEQEETSK